MKNPTNTERLIKDLETSIANGIDSVNFMVGKNTGNGPSVVAALRARGYTVDRKVNGYQLLAKNS
jgi:hypothetical protein